MEGSVVSLKKAIELKKKYKASALVSRFFCFECLSLGLSLFGRSTQHWLHGKNRRVGTALHLPYVLYIQCDQEDD